MEYTKEDLQRDAGIPHLPTDLTYELRMAVSGHKKDEFLSWGFQWTDKPHRLVFTACREIERQADEIERLRDALTWIERHPVEESKQWEVAVKEMKRLARAALQQKETE